MRLLQGFQGLRKRHFPRLHHEITQPWEDHVYHEGSSTSLTHQLLHELDEISAQFELEPPAPPPLPVTPCRVRESQVRMV